jgi:hypothetical protein
MSVSGAKRERKRDKVVCVGREMLLPTWLLEII